MRRGPRKTTPRVKDGRVQRKNHRDLTFAAGGPLQILVEVPGPGYRHVVTPEHLRRFFALIPGWEQASRGLRAVILDEGSETREGWYEDGAIGLNAWSDPIARTVDAWHFAAHRGIWERLGVDWRPAPEFIAAVDLGPDEEATLRAATRVLWDHFGLFDWSIEPDADGSAWTALDHSSPPASPTVCDLVRVAGTLHIYQRCVLVRFDRDTAAAYQLLHVFLHELGHHADALSLPRRGAPTRGEDYAEHWALRGADAIWDAYMDAFLPHRRA